MAVTRHVWNLAAMNTQIVELDVRQPGELTSEALHLPACANCAKKLVHGVVPGDIHETRTSRDSLRLTCSANGHATNGMNAELLC
jgi:hypothetical protein